MNGGAKVFRLDGSIAGRRRWLKTGPSTNFRRVIRKPMEGVVGGTRSNRICASEGLHGSRRCYG